MKGMMEGTGRRKGIPCRDWIEDIEDWCQTAVYTVQHRSPKTEEHVNNMVTGAMDTYGLSTYG